MARGTDPLLGLPDKSGALYVRLYQRLRALIIQGLWSPGMRLPSSRTLAADLGISRNTAMMALDQLLADGLIETRSRAGAYVSARPAHALPRARSSVRHLPGRPPVPFEMSQGAVDAFPLDRWIRLQSRVWSKARSRILYETEVAGDAGLRSAIAELVAPGRGITAQADDIIIVTGSQSAYDLVAAALPRGSTVVVEDPGYIFADEAFRRRGLEVVAAPVDDEGLDVGAARRLVPAPALILTMSAVHFPTTARMSPGRRADLLDWAGACGALVLEDDFDADARFDGEPPSPLLRADAPDRVLTVTSFNRLLFQSLRLGFMAVPPAMRAPLLAARESIDGIVNLPNQLVLRAFIEEGLLAAHQRHLRKIYAERRVSLCNLLEPYCSTLFDPEFNRSGLYLIARPLRHSAGEIARRLRDVGIAVSCHSDFSRKYPMPDSVLFGFAAFSPDVIEAMRPALAEALDPLR